VTNVIHLLIQGSDARKPNENDNEFRKEDTKSSQSSEEEEEEEKEKEDKNVVFCMWGHENCKTRWEC
jgi:hypothetical protein